MALRAAKYKCVLCTAEATEVDHVVPVSLGGSGDQSNLRALCSQCHKAATTRLRRERDAYVAGKTFAIEPQAEAVA
jgi:5-methylcytosine-specific restriction endonuclease McrA